MHTSDSPVMMRSLRRLLGVFVAATFVAVAAGARADVPTGAPIDGIRCDSMEGAVFHIHQHLAIFDHGKVVAVPANIGIPIMKSCLYWLHTHTDDGLIHVESPVMRTFTLGQFFDIWGQPLTPTNVAGVKVHKGDVHAFVNGSPYAGNPRSIELHLHSDIVLEAGKPYHKPAPFTGWGDN